MIGNPGASTAATTAPTATRRSPGRRKADRQRAHGARPRVQPLADGLCGQREEDRVGKPTEYQEPPGLSELPADGQLIEGVEDEGSWKIGTGAEQDHEKCYSRGGDAKTRSAGRRRDCS